MEYRNILGLISVGIAILSYSFYFRDIFIGKTKPHAFSWFIWGLLMVISFWAQITHNAGAGAWVIGFTALICFTISGIAFKNGMRHAKQIDVLSLWGALLALFLWLFLKNPTISIILTSGVYVLGFVPTFRKSYISPQDETLITYVLNTIKFFISLFALQQVTLVTAFYPFVLVLVNLSFVLMLVARRKVLA
jgi:hypothetical protein